VEDGADEAPDVDRTSPSLVLLILTCPGPRPCSGRRGPNRCGAQGPTVPRR
jgi:hypothetical protein